MASGYDVTTKLYNMCDKNNVLDVLYSCYTVISAVS